LQYNQARWYDSTTGRWISQDPLGFDAGDSNLYRYVNNRPNDYTDPSGDILSSTSTGRLPSSVVLRTTYNFVDPAINRSQRLEPGPGFIVATVSASIIGLGQTDYSMVIRISSSTPAQTVNDRAFPKGVNTGTEWFIRDLARKTTKDGFGPTVPRNNPSQLLITMGKGTSPAAAPHIQFNVHDWKIDLMDLVVQQKQASTITIDATFPRSNTTPQMSRLGVRLGQIAQRGAGNMAIMLRGPNTLGDEGDQKRKDWKQNLRVLNIQWNVNFIASSFINGTINIYQSPIGPPAVD
jgi:hypothetical protein